MVVTLIPAPTPPKPTVTIELTWDEAVMLKNTLYYGPHESMPHRCMGPVQLINKIYAGLLNIGCTGGVT